MDTVTPSSVPHLHRRSWRFFLGRPETLMRRQKRKKTWEQSVAKWCPVKVSWSHALPWYIDDRHSIIDYAQWNNDQSTACNMFLLVSFLWLPKAGPTHTHTHTHTLFIDLSNQRPCLSCRDFDHSGSESFLIFFVLFYDVYDQRSTPLHFFATNLLGKLNRKKPVATTYSCSIMSSYSLFIVDIHQLPWASSHYRFRANKEQTVNISQTVQSISPRHEVMGQKVMRIEFLPPNDKAVWRFLTVLTKNPNMCCKET